MSNGKALHKGSNAHSSSGAKYLRIFQKWRHPMGLWDGKGEGGESGNGGIAYRRLC